MMKNDAIRDSTRRKCFTVGEGTGAVPDAGHADVTTAAPAARLIASCRVVHMEGPVTAARGLRARLFFAVVQALSR